MATPRKNKFRESSVSESVDIEEKSKQSAPAEEEVKSEPRKKSESKQKASQKAAEAAPDIHSKINWKERYQRVKTVYHSEQSQKIIGLIFILSGVYLALAFTSYLFTRDVDHDKVLAPLSDFFGPDIKVQNWLGKAGALLSHVFVYKGFGLAAFILVPVMVILGIQKLIQKQIIHISSFHAKWLFMMVWFSLSLSYFFSEKFPFIGGGYGYFINLSVSNVIGNAGLLVLLAFAMLTFLVLVINLSFKLPQKNISDTAEEEEAHPDEEKYEENEHEHTFIPQTHESQYSKEEEERLLNFQVIQTDEKPAVVEEALELAVEEKTILKEEAEEVKDILLNNEPELIVNQSNENEKKGETAFEVNQVVEEPVVLEEENKAAALVEEFGEYDPTLDLGSYKFPSFDLLQDYGSGQTKVNQEELVANKDRIINTLKNYGIEIDKITATVGPTVTLYEIVPAAGVRISKIKNLEDDIALSLAALGIRIIAPIPGKGTIGIEVPNQTPEMVPMRNILASEKFNHSTFELPIALGKTISNEIFIADLAKMPHLLMAGATGQGKSVGLNAILVSLLYKKHPAQIKFVLVDPKKVELTLFNKIERHFLAKLPNSEEAIITDNTKVIHTLNSLCIEMDNRYALLQDAQVRNIKEYNAKFVARKLNPNDGHKYLPYIVLVVDEFADLIMTAGKEVETPIARLAQLARAIGIHLIIATQRPSVNIITGTIKANFPARIAFRVTSKIDSRTILDAGGAEQLIGRGDMLLSTGNDLIRIQCAFVDTPEVEKITEFIGSQRAYPTAFLLPEYVGEDGDGGKEDIDLSERDKMFDEAAKLVVQFQQGSASFLQRKLKLGYNRAGRIVDQLEAAGIIGPFEGSKAREVLVKDMMHLEEILQKLRNK